MTQATDWDTGFTPTQHMRDKHRVFVDKMVETIRAMWHETGQWAGDDEGERLLAFARSEWAVDSRPEWMHPARALAVKAGWIDTEDALPLQHRADFFDAMRTSEALSEHERARWTARNLGVGVEALRHFRSVTVRDRSHLQAIRTAVYRHFDHHGVLLYVGITHDPEERARMHGHTSPWFAWSVACAVEWHESRQDALDAESTAIRDERPLFNVSQSLVDPSRAAEYAAARADRNSPERTA